MKNNIKSLLMLALAVSFLAGGCADFRSKFIPQKKDERPAAMQYYAVREYDVKPSLDLYTKRYIYWKNWQKEIMNVIDDPNRKKLIVAVEQAISNMMDMKRMLVDEKGDQLQEYIDKMEEIEITLKKQTLTAGNKVRIRRELDSIGKQVKRYFSYNAVKNDIRDEFRTN